MKLYSFLEKDYRARLLSYVFIWLSYLYFMSKNSLMGIDWLPYQETRVRNAVTHIINNVDFVKFGITSFYEFNDSFNSIYAVQAHEYIHYVALMKLGGERVFSSIAVHIDKLALLGLCIAASEFSIISSTKMRT